MIYSYKFGSKSAKALAEGLGIKRIKHNNSKFKGNPRKAVINWGCGELPPEVARCHTLNWDRAVKIATNKLHSLIAMRGWGVRVPEFTEDADVAYAWDSPIVVRHKLNGYGGDGIEIVDANKEIPDAPLYTKYVPKKEEYRVHIVFDKVILVQRKALRTDELRPADEDINWKVRNHDNGFIFCNDNVIPPQDVVEQAMLAVEALMLDFGAVDVGWNEKHGVAYVYEVNTAPGLTGVTLEKYVDAFNAVM